MKKLSKTALAAIVCLLGLNAQAATILIDGFTDEGDTGLSLNDIDGDWHTGSNDPWTINTGTNVLTHQATGPTYDTSDEKLIGRVLDLSAFSGDSVTGANLINVDINLADGSPANYTGASANGSIASAGTDWNYLDVSVGGAANVPNGQSLSNLEDDSGVATTVGVAFGTGWSGTYENTGVGPSFLQEDRAYTSSQSVGTFTINGLDVGGSYNLALIAAPDGNGLFSTDFTIAGVGTETATGGNAGTNTNGALTFTEGATHVLFNVIANDGSITFTTKQAELSQFGVLSGLQIQAIPEPSRATLLLGLAAIALVIRRRR